MSQQSFRERDITLSSGPLHVREAGEGRPLLHLHAAGGPNVSPVLQSLTGKHRVICPVTPGFDGTPQHATVTSMPALADLYAEFIRKELSGEACDVIGESFGGRLALWLALRHPELVDHLVLEAPAGFAKPGGKWPPADPAERHKMLYAVPERAPKEPRSATQQEANRKAANSYYSGVTYDEKLAEGLKDIKARTLIVMGYVDQVIPVETGHLLKARIPQSHLTYVFGAGHVLEFDQPKRVGQLVADFLERGESFLVREPQVA